MKQGLSLRVSQHLALTPQLQQSIRLLQLSTLELSQEVEQMLDENPFLELSPEAAQREEFGVAQADTPAAQDERDGDPGEFTPAAVEATRVTETEAAPDADADAPNWEGDGSTEVVPDDGEWGGDATPRKNNLGGDEDVDATDLARGDETLQSHLHRQVLGLHLGEEDRCALAFLIESLNDDGYLDEGIESLAAGLAGDDLEEREELVHRFTVALRLLHHLEPVGVGARSLAECLTLQLQAMEAAGDLQDARAAALQVCADPAAGAQARTALRQCRTQRGHTGRAGHQGRPRPPGTLPGPAQRRGDAAPAGARRVRRRDPGTPRRRTSGAAAAAAGGALVHQEHPAALRHHPAGVQRDRRAPEEFLRARRAGDAAPGAARDRRRAGPA